MEGFTDGGPHWKIWLVCFIRKPLITVFFGAGWMLRRILDSFAGRGQPGCQPSASQKRKEGWDFDNQCAPSASPPLQCRVRPSLCLVFPGPRCSTLPLLRGDTPGFCPLWSWEGELGGLRLLRRAFNTPISAPFFSTSKGAWCCWLLSLSKAYGGNLGFPTTGSRLLNQFLLLFHCRAPNIFLSRSLRSVDLRLGNHFPVTSVWFWEKMEVNIV